MKILITAGKTATALKITKAFPNSAIFLCDYGDVPSINVGAYSFVSLGDFNGDVLAHHLLTKALDLSIDTIIPLYHLEIDAVVKSKLLFEEFGINVLLPKDVEVKGVDLAYADWAVFDNGNLVFSTFDYNNSSSDYQVLNGVYWFDHENNDFHLMSITVK